MVGFQSVQFFWSFVHLFQCLHAIYFRWPETLGSSVYKTEEKEEDSRIAPYTTNCLAVFQRRIHSHFSDVLIRIHWLMKTKLCTSPRGLLLEDLTSSSIFIPGMGGDGVQSWILKYSNFGTVNAVNSEMFRGYWKLQHRKWANVSPLTACQLKTGVDVAHAYSGKIKWCMFGLLWCWQDVLAITGSWTRK